MPPPDRWEAYSPLGKVIPKTRLIAFKVPLKEKLLDNVEEKDQFSPDILMQRLKEQDQKLGLIIDLTFTHKYYDRQEFLKHDVMHKKIFVKGHVIPSDSVFLEFAHAINRCDKDTVIGVHCTHGVNRTGYLICRYMIEQLDIEPEEAISLFNEARGHNIERENYLEDLKTRQRGQGNLPLPQSTDQESESPYHKGKRKARWRHHRDDHPGWRRNPRYEGNSGEQGRPNPYPAQGFSGGRHQADHGTVRHYDQSHNGNDDYPRGEGRNGNRPFPDRRDHSRFHDDRFRDRNSQQNRVPFRGRDSYSEYDRVEQSQYEASGWGSSSRQQFQSRRGGGSYRGHGGRGWSNNDHPHRAHEDNDRQMYRQAGWGTGASRDYRNDSQNGSIGK